MTTRLLTMAALAWASSAMAQDWEAPILPSVDDLAVEIENEGHYYATPAGTGQFLCGANSWGTQASLKKEGYEVVLYQGLELGDEATPESWNISFPAIPCKNGYAGDFLFVHNSAADIYCNAYNGANNSSMAGDRSKINFTFTANEDGTHTYRIQHYMAEGQYLGWDGEKAGSDGPQLSFCDEDADGVYINWCFIPVDAMAGLDAAYALYDAKVELYTVLNEAWENDVDTDDIAAIYKNEESTAEDIQAATATLRERILAAMQGDEEVEVTNLYIKNADCSSLDGWTYKDFSKAPNNVYHNDEDGAFLDGFLETYAWQTNLSSGRELKQTINVPAGKYRLEACVNAVDQWNKDENDELIPVYGVKLFADAGQGFQVESDDISTGNGVPEWVKIEFDCISPVTIGLRIGETMANWVGVDNFRLFLIEKYSEADLTQVSLNSRVGLLEKYLEVDDDELPLYVFSAETKATLAAFIDKCKANTDASALEGLIAEADEMSEAVKAEVAAYKSLVDLMVKLEADMEIYATYGELGEDLAGLEEDIDAQLNDEATWSIEKINEVVGGYDAMIEAGVRKFIAEKAEPGTDVSVLIKNPNMDEGEHWVNNASKPQIPGWNPESTSPWGYDKSAGEFWNMDFDFYQDIEGLPAGKYTVSFQGFWRWGDPNAVVEAWLANPNDQSKLTAVLYGNQVETTFKSICEGRVTGVNGWAVACGEDEEGNTYYIPNSMEQAQWVFTNKPKLYHTEATAVVGADGHLRIGIKGQSNEGNRWVIFDSFRLRYDGQDAELFFETMTAQAAALVAKRDALIARHSLPLTLCEEVEGLVDKCKTLTSTATTTTEECTSFFEEMSKVSKNMDEAAAIIEAMMKDAEYYDYEALNNWWPEDKISDEWQEIQDAVIDLVYNVDQNQGNLWANLDELKAMAKNINAYFVRDVFNGQEGTVTENEPYEMTEVIRNPQLWPDDDDIYTDAQENTLENWNGAWGSKSQWGLAEFYSKNFDLNQTIVSLPKGYYKMTADGFYRQGTSDSTAVYRANGTELLAAELYAMHILDKDTTVWTAPMMSIMVGSEEAIEVTDDEARNVLTKNLRVNPETGKWEIVKYDDEQTEAEGDLHFYVPNTQGTARTYINEGRYTGNSVVFHSEGGNVRLGLRKDSLTNSDWTIFDNFRLFYLGQEAPTGIGSVQQGAANTAVAIEQAYYTIGGVRLARPQRGVNIVVTKLADGTVVKSKVLVK